MKIKIRVAREDDAQAVCDIYGAYVHRLDVTFTVQNPDVEAYRAKIKNTLEHYPFYIAEGEDGKILGYVCGSQLLPHDAYRWNVESTIMLHPEAPRRKGIATELYNAFMKTLRKQNYQYIYGVIVDGNKASIELHKSLGFVEVGHFKNAGYKDGNWLGIIWMCKYIGNPNAEVKEPQNNIQYKDLSEIDL